MFDSLWQWFVNFLWWVVHSVVSFLPTSPFAKFDFATFGQPGLGWLNWFFPVRQMLELLGVWLTCVAAYYAGMAIMRKAGVLD